MILTFIRWLLGNLITFIDWLTSPKPITREPAIQRQLDQATETLTLFQYPACPFCVKVRRFMKKNSLNVTLCDAKRDSECKEALLSGGGRLKVPCLRMTTADGTQWMYESDDIIRHLQTEVIDAIEEPAEQLNKQPIDH